MMDLPTLEVSRQEAIAQRRQNIFDQTKLSFLPHSQTHFMNHYGNLPGHLGMTIRDRVKLIPDDYRRNSSDEWRLRFSIASKPFTTRFRSSTRKQMHGEIFFGRLGDDERLKM
ncbi:hypothetical protein BJX65DRAFT_17140 [Aspergillus insuetus]